MTFDPTLGPRIAPAWQALTVLLANGQWHHRRDCVDAMLAGSNLALSTCSGLLRYGVRDGLLEQSGE